MNKSVEKIKDFWNKNPNALKIAKGEFGTEEFFNSMEGAELRGNSLINKIKQIDRYDVYKKFYEFDGFKGKKILDVGCGTGRNLRVYARNGAIVTGIDISDKSIEIAKENFKVSKLHGDLLICDACFLPFNDESFDMVSSIGVLHHIPDVEKAVSEIYRVLKKDGRLKVLLYNKNSFLGFLGRFLPVNILSDGFGNPYTKTYTEKDVKKLFSKFRNLKIAPEGWFILLDAIK